MLPASALGYQERVPPGPTLPKTDYRMTAFFLPIVQDETATIYLMELIYTVLCFPLRWFSHINGENRKTVVRE